MRKAFELAERLHIPAFELIQRMDPLEVRYWEAFDSVSTSKDDYRFALFMEKLDWIKGVKKPDMKRYLPKKFKVRKPKTFEELKASFDVAAAKSQSAKGN